MVTYRSAFSWLGGILVAAVVSLASTPDSDAFDGRVSLQDAWCPLVFGAAVVYWFCLTKPFARGLLATFAISMVASGVLLFKSVLWATLMNRVFEFSALAGLRRLLDCDGGCGVVRAEFEAQLLGSVLLGLIGISVAILSVWLRAAYIAQSSREAA